MRKHTRRFATMLATTVAVSLSVFGMAVSASADDGQLSATSTGSPGELLPTIESARFSSSCFDGGPGAEGAIDVIVPEGSGPVEVSVVYGGGEVLFTKTLVATGQVASGGALPLGDYDLTILLNGLPTGGGLVSAVSCEQVANPGHPTDNITEEPMPASQPTQAAAPVATPAAPAVTKPSTIQLADVQVAQPEAQPLVETSTPPAVEAVQASATPVVSTPTGSNASVTTDASEKVKYSSDTSRLVLWSIVLGVALLLATTVLIFINYRRREVLDE